MCVYVCVCVCVCLSVRVSVRLSSVRLFVYLFGICLIVRFFLLDDISRLI